LLISSDQTTRIHAYTDRWAEIARPQIHGYDMTCGTWLGPYRVASGADEKLTRVFDAPEGFISTLKALKMEHADAGDVGLHWQS
jgi:elongator complex protein 2